MISFNADEIFEIAEQIERNGAKFYRKAAASAGEATKEMFLDLAKMEDDHEKTFVGFRAELAEGERKPTVFDMDEQVALYLQAVADGEVFADDPSEALTGTESVADILTTAIGLEKETIVFYQSIKPMVKRPAGQEKLDWIIMQEYGHAAMLTKQRKQLAG